MATMSFAATGHLQVLRDPLDESQEGVDIVLVPGIGTPPPEEWPFADEEWLATLPGSSAGTRILAYKYASPFTATKPSWESMLMLGHNLLQHISDARSLSAPDVTTSKPILLVFHSLGGILVKQALCVADKQFLRYESIINGIAGVVFLSTPHRYGDKTMSFTWFRDVFEATTSRNLKIPSINIEQEGAILLDLADRFEGISFSAPILSAYELRESKTSSTTLHQKYQQLVNREACSTRAQMETVIGLNLNHHGTCIFTQSAGGESLPELNKFLLKTLNEAAPLMSLRLDDLEQLELTESPSNKATEGTSLSGFELVSPTTPKSDIAKPLHLPCYLLNTHSANEDFCGREDILERLATELLPPKNRALERARRHKNSFDAVFWVVADEIAKLDHHYQQISLTLGLEELSECKSQVSRPIIQEHVHEKTLRLGFRSTFTASGIPLAISQMAGVIRRQDLTLSEFLELYMDHEEQASLYEPKFDTNLVTYRHSLSTVWAIGNLKPQTQQLLELISFLDPDSIGKDLLEASVELLSDVTPFKKSNYIDARTDLLQSSLVQRNQQKQQTSVHRVVQDVILATMDVERKRSIFDQVVRILWADWPSAMPKPSKEPELPQPKSSGNRLYVGRWPASAALFPHVLRMHQLWSAISDLSEATKLLFAKLLTDAAWYQKERGRTKQFDGFFETARGICESSTHPDRDSLLADIHFCVGAISMDASDFDTSRINKERSLSLVSKICKELGIADDRLYLAYAERGISQIQDRRYKEGEADLKEALRIRKALGNYIPWSGEANLSWALLFQGKLEDCNTLLLDSLAGREKALGKNDREDVRTGLILYATGNLRAAQSQWEENFEYHRKAWCHMRETVGERDFYTANITHKIADHLIRSGCSEEAISMINGALEIWSVDPNAHKNEIARTTFLKGKLLAAVGKTQKASIAFRFACRLRKEITKEDRDLKSLTMEDFDEIVAFWAR
ncbi:Tetratricopeptide-like helical [Penicillium italicum]|uniref:Tetratricopeptide-like helical n=1 Tax=Penicillium italicum TaxID=40296 RepID=A0A0A2KP72_PENIT|nr:Tetratricopeptide-like helical [Penicillium italicum]